MSNVLRVLKRDILRLLKVPPAMVVIIALLILPSLYTWYNVLGFWNPYENTGNLRVCVVNEDKGAESELTGQINVGDMIVDQLHENTQLSWQFMSYNEAMHSIDSGESYAAYVIPENFSADLLTITTSDFKQPSIKYYVNEKIGPVSPKITDTGANTLDATINSVFVETVSEKAAEAFKDAVDNARDKTDESRSVAQGRIAEAKRLVSDASSAIAALENDANAAKARASEARTTLSQAHDEMAVAQDTLNSLSGLSSDVQQRYLEFSAKATPALSAALQDAASAYSELARALSDLPNQTEEMQQFLERLRESAARAEENARRYSDVLANDIAPAFGDGLGRIALNSSLAAGKMAAQSAMVQQADALLADMISTIDNAVAALEETRVMLDGVQADLDRVETDVVSLSASNIITKTFGEADIDPQKVAEFIGAPTRLVTEQLYPLNAYGSAMAPLFMNLTFWIGAFMLMVILRQEVDGRGIPKLTLTQRYMGRYLLFACMVILQAVICCAGLPAIGVEIVHPVALFFAAIVASLSYLSIIYALSVSLQHIGKGICIILVFAQIPGATGLYPIEMTSPFFQTIYPLFPFTYGISAMRESICGFYGMNYFADLGILALFWAVFMAIGILVRPLLSNVNRMVARQIKQSGIFYGEDVEVPIRRFRMSQVVRVLADRQEYREELMRRYDRFKRMYPGLIRGALIGGIGVPVALIVVFSFGMTGKVILLTISLFWLVFVCIFLVVVESLRSSFERQLRLDNMSDEEIRNLYLKRDETESAQIVHGENPKSGGVQNA